MGDSHSEGNREAFWTMMQAVVDLNVGVYKTTNECTVYALQRTLLADLEYDDDNPTDSTSHAGQLRSRGRLYL